MKKILAVAAFAFAFSVNGYAQEAAAPADSSAPAAQKCCKKDKKCDKKCDKEGKCGKNATSPAAKVKSPATAPKRKKLPRPNLTETITMNANPCRTLSARIFSTGWA